MYIQKKNGQSINKNTISETPNSNKYVNIEIYKMYIYIVKTTWSIFNLEPKKTTKIVNTDKYDR